MSSENAKDIYNLAEDSTRLIIAAVSEGNEEALDDVRLRCIEMLGESFGEKYFERLFLTLPFRRSSLFPWGNEDIDE